jgi:hypothetical protein
VRPVDLERLLVEEEKEEEEDEVNPALERTAAWPAVGLGSLDFSLDDARERSDNSKGSNLANGFGGGDDGGGGALAWTSFITDTSLDRSTPWG